MRVGKREESTFRNKFSNEIQTGVQKKRPDTTDPDGGAFPFLSVSGSHSSALVRPSSSLLCITILGYQMAFWETGITAITYKLFRVESYIVKQRRLGVAAHIVGQEDGIRGLQKQNKTTREGIPLLFPDNFFIS